MNMRPETTFKDWIITLLLLCVPVVNIVMLVLWIIDSDKSKPFRKNFAIGYLINQAIIFVVYLLLYVTIFAAVLGAAFKTSSTYSDDTKTVVQQEDSSKVKDKKSDTSKVNDKKANTTKKYKDVQDYFDANPDFVTAFNDSVASSSGNTMTAEIEAIDNDIYINLDVTGAVKAQGITADNFGDYEYDLGESFDAQFADDSETMTSFKSAMNELFNYVDAKYINMDISVYAFDNYLSGTDCILDATAQAE